MSSIRKNGEGKSYSKVSLVASQLHYLSKAGLKHHADCGNKARPPPSPPKMKSPGITTPHLTRTAILKKPPGPTKAAKLTKAKATERKHLTNHQ